MAKIDVNFGFGISRMELIEGWRTLYVHLTVWHTTVWIQRWPLQREDPASRQEWTCGVRNTPKGVATKWRLSPTLTR